MSNLRFAGALVYNENERRRYAAMSERFVVEQAARLGYSPDEILDAVCRGWLPQEIAALPVAQAALLDGPPTAALIAKLRDAPVRPIWLSRHEARCHDGYVNKAKAA